MIGPCDRCGAVTDEHVFRCHDCKRAVAMLLSESEQRSTAVVDVCAKQRPARGGAWRVIAWLRAARRSRAQRRRLREVERWQRYWQARAMARDHADHGGDDAA